MRAGFFRCLTALLLALSLATQVDARTSALGRAVITGAAVAGVSSLVHAGVRRFEGQPNQHAASGVGLSDANSPSGYADPSQAGSPACAAQLPGGRQPTFSNPKLAAGLHVLCFEQYTVAYSEKTRTPLWSAEYLTRERIELASRIKRVNSFHEEEALAPGVRSRLSDYVRSGYDRGHLSPNKDFSTSSAQYESFSLANMIPQDPQNNQHLWEGIESGTRKFARKNGAVYVITGPLFDSRKKIQFLHNSVAVPTQIFKLVYDPVHKSGGVFVVDNIDTREIAWKSVSEFEQSSGYLFGLGAVPLMSMPDVKSTR